MEIKFIKKQTNKNPSRTQKPLIKDKSRCPKKMMDILFVNIFKYTFLKNSALVQ